MEAKAQNEHLLTTARMQLEEQEDEIKALNEMILQVRRITQRQLYPSSHHVFVQAKIYSIRDAQLAEQEEIRREQADEERRLDDMMEIDRVKALQRLEEQEQQLKTVRQRGAREIRTQVYRCTLGA